MCIPTMVGHRVKIALYGCDLESHSREPEGIPPMSTGPGFPLAGKKGRVQFSDTFS